MQDAINGKAFRQKWDINKDEIEICKDCEFRHMCLDCRVFIDDPNNAYSRPSKCGYNPYICKWEGEEGFVPINEIGYYKDNRFKLDAAKIKKYCN